MTDAPGEPKALSPDDHAKFDLVYRAHSSAVHRYVVARFPGLDADGIVSEVFISAWRKRETVCLMDNPRYWLIKCAHNAGIDQIRATKEFPAELSEYDTPLVSPIGDAHARLELLDTLQAIDELSGRQRESLLRYYSGLEPQEIAEAMSCKLGTVYSHLDKARKRLKRIIDGPRKRKRDHGRTLPLEPPHYRGDRPDREDQ